MGKFDLNIFLFAGKGGVGKTTLATSFAIHQSSLGRKVAVLDYDGGHSVARTLGITKPLPVNSISVVRRDFAIAIVEEVSYKSVARIKEEGGALSDYLAQFAGDYGIVPWHMMTYEFFGLVTDIDSVQKFATLVTLLYRLEEDGYQDVVIDVEPTAGLKRLLVNTRAFTRSLQNLRRNRLTLIGATLAWPDIGGYLKSTYVDSIAEYADRMERVSEAVRGAAYAIVTIPEESPVAQCLQVIHLIESYRGQVSGIVVNNVRHEPHEETAVELLPDHLPRIEIMRRTDLHGTATWLGLAEIGKRVASLFA